MSTKNLFSAKNRVLTILFLVAAAVAMYGYMQPDNSVAGRRYYIDNSGGAVLFTHAAHQQYAGACITCHHDLVKSTAVDCSACHDDPDYVPEEFEHDELVEIEDHSCDGCHDLRPDEEAASCRDCHDPETISEIYHNTCTACHRQQAAERFIDDQDQAKCKECHLK
jgi:hypothetical protein